MKKFTIRLIVLTTVVLQAFVAKSQVGEKVYPFKNMFNDWQECTNRWYAAGSATEKRDYHLWYVVVNVKNEFGLKTDGSDNTGNLGKGIAKFKNDYPGILLVVYFPAGEYKFNKSIVLEGTEALSISDVVLKGEAGSILFFNHENHGIFINNAERIGIEDLSITRTPDYPILKYLFSLPSGNNIRFEKSKDCWVSGIYSTKSWEAHVLLNGDEGYAENITIKGCSFIDALAHGDDGQGYGVCFNKANACLLENSIFSHLRHSKSFQHNSAFNVVAYNASYDPYWTNFRFALPFAPDLSFHGRFYDSPGPPLGGMFNLAIS